MNSWLSGAEAGARERPLVGRGLLLGAIMFLNEVEVVVARLCECTKNHCTRHLNRVNFMGCELHLNFFFKKKEQGAYSCNDSAASLLHCADFEELIQRLPAVILFV